MNLLPLLKDKTPLDRSFLCGESFSHDIIDMDQHEATLQYRWCIEGKWKLILSYDSPPDRYAFVYSVNERTPQLFDLEADPHEKQNLASSHAQIVQNLAKHLNDTWSVSKKPVGL